MAAGRNVEPELPRWRTVPDFLLVGMMDRMHFESSVAAMGDLKLVSFRRRPLPNPPLAASSDTTAGDR
jgi:hypothetical protein